MSRIGKKEIKVPSGVEVSLEDAAKGVLVKVKGPKGELSRVIRPEIAVSVEGDQIIVKRNDESRKARALHGLSTRR